MMKRRESTCNNQDNSVRREAQNETRNVTRHKRNIRIKETKKGARDSEGRSEPNYSSDKTIDMSHAGSKLAIKPQEGPFPRIPTCSP
jgi:hypothetical protein